MRPSRLPEELVPQGYQPLTDAVKQFGVSESFVRANAKQGQIAAITILGRIYVATDDLRQRLAPKPYPRSAA